MCSTSTLPAGGGLILFMCIDSIKIKLEFCIYGTIIVH